MPLARPVAGPGSALWLTPRPACLPQVEDIVDSGRTAVALLEHFKAMGAASVALVSLLSKPARRTVPCDPDYLCFEVVSAARQPGRARGAGRVACRKPLGPWNFRASWKSASNKRGAWRGQHRRALPRALL